MGVKADSVAAKQRPPERLAMDGEAGCHLRDDCYSYANQRTSDEAIDGSGFPMRLHVMFYLGEGLSVDADTAAELFRIANVKKGYPFG